MSSKFSSSTSQQDLSSLADSVLSEERLDSDLEADLNNCNITDDTVHSGEELLSLNSYDTASDGDYTFDSSKLSFESKQPSLLRKTLLNGISNQLASFSSKPGVGHPTCLSLKKHLIVGTECGILLVFDVQQVLRLSFAYPGPISNSPSRLSRFRVTSLAQNRDGSQLVSGYQNGRLAIWRLCASTNDNYDSRTLGRAQLQTIDSSEYRLQPSTSSETKPLQRTTGQLISVVDDAHGADQAIALCAFTTIPTLIVCTDTGGSVFQIRVKRRLTSFKIDSVCFFSGSRGEICALESLCLDSTHMPRSLHVTRDDKQPRSASALASHALIAMASFTKMVIVCLRPKIQIVHWQKLAGPSTCLPLLSWKWTNCSGTSTATLAFGRGSNIYILLVNPTASSNYTEDSPIERKHFTFQLSHSLSMDTLVINLKWMPSKDQLTILDINENLHLLNTETGRTVESMDLSSVQLTYHAETYKSLMDSRLISDALALAGQRSCTHTVVSHGSQLILLGLSGVHLVSLRSWSELVQSLFSCGSLEHALYHCNMALHRSIPDVHTTLSNTDHADVIVDSDLTVDQLKWFAARNLRQYVVPKLVVSNDWSLTARMIDLFVSICEYVDDDDLLFNVLFPNMPSNPQWRSWYHTAIFRLIRALPLFGQLCDEKLSNKRLASRIPPNVSSDLLKWCLDLSFEPYRIEWSCMESSTRGTSLGHSWAECCILRLPPHCLDLNEVVPLSRSHHLFTAYLHLYTDILMDFNTPFVELSDLLQSPSKKAHSSVPLDRCAAHLLLLLRSAFASQSSSGEQLPAPMCHDVPVLIFNYLVKEVHHGDASDRLELPYLHLFLEHNAVDFLNMLTLSTTSDRFFCDSELGDSRRVCLYHKLIACVHAYDFPSYAIDVFVFIVQHVTSGDEKKLATVFSKLPRFFSDVCKSVSHCPKTRLASFEYAAVELLSADLLPNVDECLRLARSTGLFQVCEFIHRLRGQHEEVFKDQLCKLRQLLSFDSLTQTDIINMRSNASSLSAELQQLTIQVFAFLERLQRGVSAESYPSVLTANAVYQLVFHDLLLFSVLDPKQTLCLLSDQFTVPVNRLLQTLVPISYIPDYSNLPDEESNNRLACFLLLRDFFRSRKQCDEHSVMSIECDPNEDLPANSSWRNFLNDTRPEVVEFFIRLHVSFDPDEDSILDVLSANKDFRANILLQMLDVNHFPRTVALLHESAAEYEKAFDIHKQLFLTQWGQLIRQSDIDDDHREKPDVQSTVTTERICEQLRSSAEPWFGYCDRVASMKHHSNHWTAETVWFKVVDVLLEEQNGLTQRFGKTQMNELFHLMLSYASPTVSLPSIMLYILQTTESSSNTVSLNDETSALLTRLVTTCQLEVDQIALNKRVADEDLTQQHVSLVSRVSRGIPYSTMCCAWCTQPIRLFLDHVCGPVTERQKDTRMVLAFGCGHLYHKSCLKDAHCPVCNQSTYVPKSHQRGNSTSKQLLAPVDSDDLIKIDKPKVYLPKNPFDS